MNEDTQKLLGHLLPADGPEVRDAVHIAVVSLVAGEDLQHGEEIGLAWGSKNVALRKEKCYGLRPIGVVDPFLEKWQVQKGQRFFCFLFPGTATGLRHVYSHPALDNVPVPANESEAWLRAFADRWGFDYYEMIAGAQEMDYDSGRNSVVAMGRDLHGAQELGTGEEESFWKHVQFLLGREFTREHREKFGWSCSC